MIKLLVGDKIHSDNIYIKYICQDSTGNQHCRTDDITCPCGALPQIKKYTRFYMMGKDYPLQDDIFILNNKNEIVEKLIR